MHSPDDVQYAMETTRVLLEPDRRIETFGTTSFAGVALGSAGQFVRKTTAVENIVS